MKKLLGILLFISIALSANAQLLWKVSGKGLEKPSYIFGTYHLSPLSIKDSIAAMPQAMSETAQVYGEVVMSEMATPAFMQSMQQQMMNIPCRAYHAPHARFLPLQFYRHRS